MTVLGVESRPSPRRGALPADGPDQWTAGTALPFSSQKTARGIKAASGNRPLVALANMSLCDGSPESLRKVQREYGAEIGRAIVIFDGPIALCVASRYCGDACFGFSGVLNESMEVVAIEGSSASVIGGASDSANVFSRDVPSPTSGHPRVPALAAQVDQADEVLRAPFRVELADPRIAVRSEKLGEVVGEFEQVHNIERALPAGSVQTIIAAREWRPYLIGAVERGSRGVSADAPTTAVT